VQFSLGRLFGVDRPVCLGEHGQDQRAKQLVAVVLSHGSEA
jgi:hypothetical protein